MSRSYRILIVDDQTLIRSITAECFRDDGHEVFEATNGQEAIALLSSRPVDAIVMDIQMPVLNGIEATRRIKHDACLSQIAVFAFSGGPALADFEPELFAEVLYKPLNPFDVRQAVVTYLDSNLTP